MRFSPLLPLLILITVSCTNGETPVATGQRPKERPSILLVTLDTTRADAMTAEVAPVFTALAARGIRYNQAYATVPQTLPSHASMMTGLYPAGHGVHENGRFLGQTHPTAAERLREAGYRTAAFVSAFAVAKRFGLGRGFEVYDDSFGAGAAERSAKETTDRAIAHLDHATNAPQFLWVHYYDPHHPYTPPEPQKTRYAASPYLGEVAAMDEQLGRLVAAFEKSVEGPSAIIVSADHGEGLGDHGEAQHGNLLYQSTMHIPMLIAGPGVQPGVSNTPVSLRRIYFTILDWAGVEATNSLRGTTHEPVVVGEAMQPFLQYGWQPQVMAVDQRHKVIRAGAIEVYEAAVDPKETRDLGTSAPLSRELRQAIRDYPIPTPAAPAEESLDAESRRQLASLGYIASNVTPVVRPNAPSPRAMMHLFDELERASSLFVAENYRAVVPLLEQILAADRANLSAALRLGVAHSGLGNEQQALAAFRRAEEIAPDSADVRLYLALHYARTSDWQRAVPLLERTLNETPNRLPALEALATLRERQRNPADALRIRQHIATLQTPTMADLVRIGELAMATGNTPAAIEAFERARRQPGFRHDLELGVLYLDARRFQDARGALDRVTPDHPAFAMALFKRAQVSVLLREPDAARRIEAAREGADETTRNLIAREQLFR
jgi:tetratricopeptide (TPR) repeat protein